jgi:hypothetical protein
MAVSGRQERYQLSLSERTCHQQVVLVVGPVTLLMSQHHFVEAGGHHSSNSTARTAKESGNCRLKKHRHRLRKTIQPAQERRGITGRRDETRYDLGLGD